MESRAQTEKIPGSREIPAYLSDLGWKKEGDEDMGGNANRTEGNLRCALRECEEANNGKS